MNMKQHIYSHILLKNLVQIYVFLCVFILRLLKKITDFLGKTLKHIRIIRKITNDLQMKFDRMLSVFLFDVKNQKK